LSDSSKKYDLIKEKYEEMKDIKNIIKPKKVDLIEKF